MTIRRFVAAALLGLSFIGIPGADGASAQSLRVVKKGTAATLDVPMNRAVVVESETPFAELSIANPGIADISSLSDRTIYVLGKSPGLTTLTLLDGAGQLITNVEVRVAADVTEFKERLRQILPNETIEVRTANDGIVLSGVVSSSARLQRALDLAERYAPERVSNLMSVGGIQQVMLEVRFAEMQRSVTKSLSASLATGSSNKAIETGTMLLSDNGLNSETIVPQTDIQGAFLFDFGVGNARVRLLLEALERKGLVRTLAEPNLSALSGQEANFLAGGEYPVPTTGNEGEISIEYKPFGIELSFIPRVVDGDLINLELVAAVSALDPSNGFTLNNLTVSAFTRREASTTVELRDGESFAIAGLIEDNFLDNNAQVPWLGDVPILGALFRSSDFQHSQSELVIIVSAHLVTPTRGEALVLPTDRVKAPSEGELFLFGKTERNAKGAAAEVARQDFNGSYGYVLD
ncbi:type II and III secretion system protein family protein [Leisingera sp. S132]|uniref:type II and III secretion system protein family protein n=1 Tax=Leisingera sp. S132 TaxID=2867016 RepID=UPI0021A49B25|nr:type II and III secretion system protein family protein [Leisingera sp. S132]UWQ78457.1 type II and III secretion system protein family protein [Leisingera sp. S132]